MHQSIKRILSRIPLMARSLGLYGLLIGALITVQLILPPSPKLVVAAYQPVVKLGQAHYVVQGMPSTLAVDRLGLNLPVKSGTYDSSTGAWTLSNTDAFFATNTSEPNDYTGTTLIYGHNRVGVFSILSNLTSGDIAKLTTDNGHTFSYSYSHDEVIKPDDTTIFDQQAGKPQLLLMTCDGIWSTGRRVMFFDLIGVDV